MYGNDPGEDTGPDDELGEVDCVCDGVSVSGFR